MKANFMSYYIIIKNRVKLRDSHSFWQILDVYQDEGLMQPLAELYTQSEWFSIYSKFKNTLQS